MLFVELKELQQTYNALIFQVQALLDTRIQPPLSIKKPSSSSLAAVLIPSPNFFSQLKPRCTRSNTTRSTTTSNDTPFSQMQMTAGYKSFVDVFCST